MSAIPTKSRETVKARDNGRCIRCGGRGSHLHHRRSRSVKDDHQHCPCNLILLCGADHADVHSKGIQSRHDGHIVMRHVLQPSQIPVLTAWGEWNLKCDGSFTPNEKEQK